MGEHAVVLGGGIAGLAASTVLAQRFERVTVVERDHYGDVSTVRPHTPQGAHVHALLAGGLHSLARLVPELPGWFDELGMPEGDLTEQLRFSFAGRWLPKTRSGVPIRPCSRSALEHLLRRAALRHANVELREGCKVTKLELRGARPKLRCERDDAEQQLDADLIVDAGGRASSAHTWLVENGAEVARRDSVDPGVIYSSCSFQLSSAIDDDWALLGVSPRVPTDPNAAAIMRTAPDRLLCAAIAYGRPTPPRSPEQFLDYMAKLAVPEPYQLLRDATPSSAVLSFSATQNRRRRYDRATTTCDGLVCIGDALCCLNPRYGQGMTVAALAAELLGTELDRHFGRGRDLSGFSAAFHRGLDRLIAQPWSIALAEDRLWAAVFSGAPLSLRERAAVAASSRMLAAVFSKIETFVPFMRVAHLLDEPSALASPRFLAALLRRPTAAASHAPNIALVHA